jgi:phosphoenolpyruvate-protein kinase (PTS system EI component)
MRLTVALSYEAYDSRLAARLNGVGLVRSEYIFRAVGKYPSADVMEQFVVPYLVDTSSRVPNGVVWYRTLEVDSAEANVLKGVEEILIEPDRLLGLRGIRRSMAYPEAFHAELEGVARARAKGANIGVILPFVTYVDEVAWALEQVARLAPGCPVATMVETPAALLELDRIVAMGICRAVIGCNDLSSLLLARPRAVREPVKPCSPLLRAIAHARELTWPHGVELAVAGYLHPQLIESCRTLGVDECVVHYSDLPTVCGDEWADLPDLGVLPATKARTREAIRAFNQQAGVKQRVY